jgi:conjugative transfer signal peptidase TraF
MTRFGYVITTYFAVLAVGGLSFIPPTPRLLWNATASTPLGLYAVQPARHLAIGDLAAVMPPERLADFLADGGYLPHGVPLLKHVTGLPGQQVCRVNRTIQVDGVTLGEALDRDRHGRALPAWNSCRRLRPGEVFLMNPAIPDSFDGRYFGPIPVRSILGRAVPLLTDENGDSHFRWRAKAR